MLTLK
jgi:hypothetical protein